MIAASLEEYKEICVLTREASSSVLKYSSVGIAVSGAILVGILRATSTNGIDSYGAASLMAILATATSYLHLLINYKCQSHNRLVAYKSLISCEAISNKSEIPSDNKANSLGKIDTSVHLASFGLCMGYINGVMENKKLDVSIFSHSEIDRERDGIFYKTSSIDREKYVAEGFPLDINIYGFAGYDEWSGKEKEKWSAQSQERDTSALRKISQLILSGELEGEVKCREPDEIVAKGETWQFPLYVARLMFFVIFLEAIIAAGLFLFSLLNVNLQGEVSVTFWTLLTLFATACLLHHLWSICIENLKVLIDLKYGYSTIERYFRQMVPYRILYITQVFEDALPYYRGIPLNFYKERNSD